MYIQLLSTHSHYLAFCQGDRGGVPTFAHLPIDFTLFRGDILRGIGDDNSRFWSRNAQFNLYVIYFAVALSNT